MPRLEIFSDVEILILVMLATNGEMYGKQMVEDSEGKIKKGTIYTTLDRLEELGIIESRLEKGGLLDYVLPKKYYKITNKGCLAVMFHAQLLQLSASPANIIKLPTFDGMLSMMPNLDINLRKKNDVYNILLFKPDKRNMSISEILLGPINLSIENLFNPFYFLKSFLQRGSIADTVKTELNKNMPNVSEIKEYFSYVHVKIIKIHKDKIIV
ncbi:MAG: hypothetical protein FD167_406, partial [bacterium]